MIDLLNCFVIFFGECLGRDILLRENFNLYFYWYNEFCLILIDFRE